MAVPKRKRPPVRRPFGRACDGGLPRSGGIAAAVVIAEITVVGQVDAAVVRIVTVILIAVILVVRRLVEEALAGITARSDIVEAGIAGQRAAGLIATAPGAAVSQSIGVAE